VDIVQSKLDFAKEFCATSTFIPSPSKEEEEKMAASERNAAQLLLELGGQVLAQGGVDLVLECTGAPPCIQMGVFLCKIRGTMVQVGMGAKDVTIPLWRVNIRVSEDDSRCA
jgi:D-xylulose reductase